MLDQLLSESKEDRLRKLLEGLRKAANALEDASAPVLVVTHYDADGLCAAAALTIALEKLSLPYQLRVEEQLTLETVKAVLAGDYGTVIFLDMGSGLIGALKPSSGTEVLVIDHHLPQGIARDGVLEVNPHRYGVDGSSEASASTLAFLVLTSICERADTYVHLALIGALGDRQDRGPRFALTGLNGALARLARRRGLVEEVIGLRLYGVHTRPLVRALALTMDPILPGLTGNEEACLSFLKTIGVKPAEGERLRRYSDLSLEERRTLATELVKLLVNSGYSVYEAERIFGVMYYLSSEPSESPLKDAREFSYVVNACGRLDRHDIGLLLLRGMRGEVLAKALSKVRAYRKLLFKALKAAEKGESVVLNDDLIIVLDYGTEIPPKAAGAVASILSSSLASGRSLLIVLAKLGEDKVKVSARRGTGSDKVNVGEIMASAAARVGGVGGGHAEAGGALIPSDRVNDFIEEVRKRVGAEG